MSKSIDSILRRPLRPGDMQKALSLDDIRWLRQMASGKHDGGVPDEVLRKFVSLKLAIFEHQGFSITAKGLLAVKILG